MKPNYIQAKEDGDQERQRGEDAKALQFYKTAVDLRPQYAAAHYEIATLMVKSGKSLDAIASYAAAYVFSRFEMFEAALMMGRVFLQERLTLEATLLFEKVPINKFDPTSKLIYAEALRLENRLVEACNLVQDQDLHKLDSPGAYRFLVALYVSNDQIDLAKEYLKKAELHDSDGFITDQKIGLFYRTKELNKLRDTLFEASNRFNNNNFYLAQLQALEILTQSNISDPRPILNEHHIVDAALYFKRHVESGTLLLGTTPEGLAYAAKQVTIDGIGLEFGVRNGDTINSLAKNLPSMTFFGFDSFQGIPEAWNGEVQYSYSTSGRPPKVESNVQLVVGWYSDTLPIFKPEKPIAIVNIDCDIYSSTASIFQYLSGHFVEGTIIIFDEYIGNESWRNDEFKAFQEWVDKYKVQYQYLSVSFFSKQVIVKILSINLENSY